MATSTSDLKSRTQADTIKPDLKCDEYGVISGVEDQYEESLKSVGMTLDQVKKLQKHDASFIASTALAAGETAADFFKTHEDLNASHVKYQLGHNTFEHHYARGEGQPAMRTVGTMHGVEDKGELKKVRTYLGGLFEDINS